MHLFVLISGKIRVEKGGKMLRLMKPVTVFGETAVSTDDDADRVRTCTCRAVSNVSVLSLSRQDFFRICEDLDASSESGDGRGSELSKRVHEQAAQVYMWS